MLCIKHTDLAIRFTNTVTGGVPSGLKIHPNRQHMIYPVGCTIVIEDLPGKKQEFLSGHSDNISCIAISNSGKYIASGQITYMGFKVSAGLFTRCKVPTSFFTLHVIVLNSI